MPTEKVFFVGFGLSSVDQLEPTKVVTKPGTSIGDHCNFRQLWSVDRSYWAATSVGYGRPTKVKEFHFLKKKLESNTGSGSHNRQ
jgi:hypothetical protein